MSSYLNLTDDRGLAVLVHRDAIAVIRDADPALTYMRSIMILKSGATIALQTEFQNVQKRLQQSDEGDTKCPQ